MSGLGARFVSSGTALRPAGQSLRTSAGRTRVCVGDPVTARATASPGRLVAFAVLITGTGIGGPGTFAAGDTTVSDSFNLSHTTTTNSVTLTINGRMFLDNGLSRTGKGQFRVLVYQDSASAVADSDHDGTGAAFIGQLNAATGPNQTPSSSTSGQFSGADFSVTTNGGRLEARATNLQKTVSVLDGSRAVVKVVGDEEGMNVPGYSTLMLWVLALMLGGTALLVFRRRVAVS